MSNQQTTRLDYPTDDALERIVDAHANGGKGDGVRFRQRYQHDAINYTLEGEIDIDDVTYGFIIDDGNWNGTVVKEWGDPEDVGLYEPPVVEPRTFVPAEPLAKRNPAMFGVYLAWRQEEWFKKMESDYNYDRHFQPGCQIENHYRDRARQKGLKVGSKADYQQDLDYYNRWLKMSQEERKAEADWQKQLDQITTLKPTGDQE